MRGQVKELYKVYAGSSNEIVIPVYQRNYDWKIKHCDQLLSDLAELVVTGRPKHFFGAIVGVPKDSWTWVVIDGQQRLTTVSLLMLALAELTEAGILDSRDEQLAMKIRREYLVVDGLRKTKFRLKPVKDDNEAYQRLFQKDESQYLNASNVTSNYRHFLARLPELGLSADEIWDAVCRLEVMHLDLEQHDDPQRIFESLNSTGLALSESDKVRNLVLMGLEPAEQERVYEDYWNRIEKNVDFETDTFLRWYLISTTATVHRQDQVYEVFKRFAADRGQEGAKLLEEVRDYSEYARQIRRADSGDRHVDFRLYRLGLLRTEVVFPFLMPVMADYRHGLLKTKDLVRVLSILESYLARRMICGVGTQGLNKIFATLYRDLRRIRPDDVDLADVLAYNLLEKTSPASAFPTDEVFAAAFTGRNTFAMRPESRQYIFECLENLNSKDWRDIAGGLKSGSLTVEHIMPQTLTAQWRDQLGPDYEAVHDTWVHRIGNLTVTGYNSEYSNASFAQKKEQLEGLDATPFRINASLVKANQWGAEEIESRGRELLERAESYWLYPTTAFQPPKPRLPQEPFGTESDFTHRAIVSFTYGGTHQTVKNWRDFFRRLLRILMEDHRPEMFAFADAGISPRVCLVTGSEPPEEFTLITEGFAAKVSGSVRDKQVVVRQLFDFLGLDPDDIVLTLRASSNDQREDGEDTGESRYAELTKFLDPLDDVRGEDPDTGEVTQLGKEFAQAFAPFPLNNSLEILGQLPHAYAADEEKMRSAGERELRALMSGVVALTENGMQPLALSSAIAGGDLAAWIRKLDATQH